jgi:enamine deaminase RidA (YjgF/YER057c/UK114 family)
MEKREINLWSWQDSIRYSQAIEVVDGQRVLYCAGQAATSADGLPACSGDMYGQLNLALDNVETVLRRADYRVSDIVRLNIYTTDVDGLFANIDTLMARLHTAGCRPASTLIGVTRLAFPELLVELEATAVQ